MLLAKRDFVSGKIFSRHYHDFQRGVSVISMPPCFVCKKIAALADWSTRRNSRCDECFRIDGEQCVAIQLTAVNSHTSALRKMPSPIQGNQTKGMNLRVFSEQMLSASPGEKTSMPIIVLALKSLVGRHGSLNQVFVYF